MKTTKITFLTFLLVSMFINLEAQDFRYPVVARITQTAPYPIYLNEYASPAQNNFSVQLEVRDNSLPTRQIKLRLWIQGPGIIIQSTPVVQNEQTIELSSGQTYHIPNNQIANYFQNHNLLISPQQYANSLEEGTYQFGIEVIDANTGRALSGVQYGNPIWMTVNEPPIFAVPENDDLQQPLSPQNINFQWIPRHKNVTDVEYEFTITEINSPNDYLGNYQNLFLSQPPIYSTKTRQTTLNYNYALPPLIPGRIYAYRVRAIAKQGLEEIGIFRNNGFSEIQWFKYDHQLLPPLNEKVERSGRYDFNISWEGHDNDESYELFYREKGADWSSKEIPKVSSKSGVNIHDDILYLLPEGSYDFQIAVKGSPFYETAYGPIFHYKDTIKPPFDLKPLWLDSTQAYLSWSGYPNHTDFKILYATNIKKDWKEFKYDSPENYSLQGGENSYAAYISHLNWDSSYLFKIVAFDVDRDSIVSQQAYLKYEDREEVKLLLEEKSISGNVSWAFLEEELAQGAISGTAQEEWNRLNSSGKTKTTKKFIHNNQEVSNLKYPLAEAKIEVFADESCQVLLKTIAAGSLGGFNVSFPAEALRGGLLPDKIYLSVKHEVFGTFKKEINSNSFENSLDVGEWVIPAKTFRFTTELSERGFQSSNPRDHLVKVYRRVSSLVTAPYAKYENFKSGSYNVERINNEDYFQVAELKPGEFANGMFYAASKFKQEYLLKIEGPSPYLDKLQFAQLDTENGVYEITVPISQKKGKPYIHGNISYENSLNEGKSVKLVLTSPNGTKSTLLTGNDNSYRFNLSTSAATADLTYQIEVYFKNNLVETVNLKLDKSNLGTRKDFLIKQRYLTAVMVQLLNEENEPLKNTLVEYAAYSFTTDGNGWLHFLAPENSTANLQIRRPGYDNATISLPISSQIKNNRTDIDRSLVKQYIEDDFTSLAENLPTDAKPNNYKLGYYSHLVGSQFLQSKNQDAFYAGASIYRSFDDAKPKAFQLTFKVIDKETQQPIKDVVINENRLDVIGQTNTEGLLMLDSHIGRGNKVFNIMPSSTSVDAQGQKYGNVDIPFEFPPLKNGQASTQTITIELESGGKISGIVYKYGTSGILANVNIQVDFLGTQTTTTTDENGYYSVKFQPSEDENFLTIEATKDGYYDRIVHMATAESYGLTYTRDIYIKIGAQTDSTINSKAPQLVSLYGFNITEITQFDSESMLGQILATYPDIVANIPVSGTIADRQGNTFEFADVNLKIEGKGVSIPTFKFTSPIVSLVHKSGEMLFANKLDVKADAAIYLRPVKENDHKIGMIYTKSFSLEESKLSSDILSVYQKADLTKFSQSNIGYKNKDEEKGITYNKDLGINNFENMPYPIAYSNGDIPISQLKFISKKSNTSSAAALQELFGYYETIKSDNKQLEKMFQKSNVNKSVFQTGNLIFEALTLSPITTELHNMVVMPLMSIPNIHISLLNIDKLRLANESISGVLIDYSRSPRKLSMGADVVQAQIEEVYVESDGVEIVYFTNNDGNKIKANSESLKEISYNANGISYSDYKNQKEVVQTAAVLNEVEMFKIPQPAMEPGSRIKITASARTNTDGFGYIEQIFREDIFFATNTGNSYIPKLNMPLADTEGSLTLEGLAEISIDPHDFMLSWKYSDADSVWAMKLESWKSNNFWGYTVLRPKQFAGSSTDVNIEDKLMEDGLTSLPEANLNDGEINIVYGAAIPLISTFDMEVVAKWDESANTFNRETASASGSLRLPTVISLEVGGMLFFDSTNKVNGLFLSVNGNLEIVGAEISGSGGYVNVNGDIIWGGSLAVASEGGIGAPSFKMYSLKAGFLYDKATDATFLQLATSIGIGKEQTFPAEIVQYLKDSTATQTADKATTDAAIKQKWKKGNSHNPIYIGFDELFFASSGRSGYEPKNHDVSLSDAEVTVAFIASKPGAFTLTGASGVALKGQYLLDAAFLISNDPAEKSWRFFLGIPSFSRATVGPFIDFTANFQLDVGSKNDKTNFFIMGAAEGDWPVHAIVYLKLSAKIAIGVNAETDSEKLADATTAGGQTLSETASKVVQFMGSSFNDIAEQSIQQRTAFFDAIPDSFKDGDGLFSGLYFGIKAAVLLGVAKEFSNDFVSGSARAGIGIELQLGLLKSFNDGQFELRFSGSPVIDLGVKSRAPIDMILFEYTIQIAKICGAGYTSDIASKEKWKWRFLFQLFAFDEIIGAGGDDADCNSVGLFYWRPCIYFYFYTDPDKAGYENGKWVMATEEADDFQSTTCPIEW